MKAKAWCIVMCCLASLAAQAQTITVSAATSLGEAMREIAPLFEATYPGQRVRVTVGASGALVQQAVRGGLTDVLVTADSMTMDQAEAKGLLAPGSRSAIATHTLVLIQKVGATPLTSLDELAGAPVGRISLGQPDAVPAGRLAQGVLEEGKLWPRVKPKVVSAPTVRQVLDAVSRGEVDAGFVYASEAQRAGSKVRMALKVATAPIVVTIAPMVASTQSAIAARFVEFVLTPRAQAVLLRHGLGRP